MTTKSTFKPEVAEKKEIELQAVRGRSPCGLEYSIEATLTAPQNHPFPAVAGALSMLGEVKYAEDLGAAVVKTDYGRATVFANGHIMIIAGKSEAEELLRRVSETILRVQMCTRCRICMKNCDQGAITVNDTFTIDGEKVQSLRKMCQRVASPPTRLRRSFTGSPKRPWYLSLTQ